MSQATVSHQVSVLVGGIVVHHLGPAAFFPLAAAPVVLALAVAITQESWRSLGAIDGVPVPVPGD